MTTYNSYEEAKIANPNNEIIQSKNLDNLFRALEVGVYTGWNVCNPADHCMTNNDFIKSGNKILPGDIVLDDGNFIVVKTSGDVETYNQIVKGDDVTFILRAAALNKPKRVKVEYVKVDFEKTIEMIDGDFCIHSDLFFMWSETNVVPINQVTGKDLILNRHKLCRRIETPIEWWEDAVDFAKQCKHVNTAVYLRECDSIDIDGSMTRDEACDFARILLEQGEDQSYTNNSWIKLTL